MNFEKCALVMPSSVHVSAPRTALTDARERKKQYLDALTFFIRESPLRKIIICDNSGFTYPPELHQLALQHKKQLEILTFKGDEQQVAEFGKGYGEGQIMEFVLANSLLIKTVEGFLKVTGRLKVINANSVFRHCHEMGNYFMPVSLLKPRFMVPTAVKTCVDTRVYYTNKTFFRDVLLTAYKEVRDNETFFLEHAYYKHLVARADDVICFPIAPEIIGMSGSNGWMFTERNGVKKLLIRLATAVGYIRPVRRVSRGERKG